LFSLLIGLVDKTNEDFDSKKQEQKIYLIKRILDPQSGKNQEEMDVQTLDSEDVLNKTKNFQNLASFLGSLTFRNSQTHVVDVGSHIMYVGIIGRVDSV
jgi:hypothetical protein